MNYGAVDLKNRAPDDGACQKSVCTPLGASHFCAMRAALVVIEAVAQKSGGKVRTS